MLFSIIIPNYNYGHYLPQGIASFMNQECQDFEIIIIDDGSKDNSPLVVADLQKKYPGKISYTYQENKGVGVARNTGFAKSSGEYCLFIDPDDQLLPHALSTIQSFIKQHPETDAIFCSHQEVFTDGRIKPRTIPPFHCDNLVNFRRFMHKEIDTAPSRIFIKRSCFEQIKYPEHLPAMEDIVFMAKVLASSQCVSLQEILVACYMHSDSARHNHALILKVDETLDRELFDWPLLPKRFRSLRNEFASLRCFELFRTAYLSKKRKEAISLYHQAIKAFPRNLFKLSYLRKYLKTWMILKEES